MGGCDSLALKSRHIRVLGIIHWIEPLPGWDIKPFVQILFHFQDRFGSDAPFANKFRAARARGIDPKTAAFKRIGW